jgi:hypothetical protein
MPYKWETQRRMRKLSLDEARLRPHLRAGREKGKLPASAAPGDVLEAEVVRRKRGRAAVASPGELRGLPAVGWGVAGAQPGSQPERALIAKENRRRRV